MDTQQYNALVANWTAQERARLKANVATLTEPYTGSLRAQLTARTVVSRTEGEAQRIAFRFPRHGVYVAYGVGRGYIRSGGQVVRGSKNPKTRVKSGALVRQPKDWFDSQLEKDIEQLADVAGEYYGDKTTDAVLRQMDRMKIVKRGSQ